MKTHILQQISYYRSIVEKFERKYDMTYFQFESNLQARAKKLATEPSGHQQFMLEEEDTLDWKIAAERLESWLKLKTQTEALRTA